MKQLVKPNRYSDIQYAGQAQAHASMWHMLDEIAGSGHTSQAAFSTRVDLDYSQ